MRGDGMDEANRRTDKSTGMSSKKQIIISIAAGIAAMAIFLAIYFFISSQRKNIFYEGEGSYSAFMSLDEGILSEYGGLEIELASDGKCIVTVGGQSKKGKWTRAGERIEINVGGKKFTGSMDKNNLELTYSEASPTVIFLAKEGTVTAAGKIPSGKWRIISLTDGDTFYPEEMLEKSGFGSSYIELDENGEGTADILNNGLGLISVTAEYIKYKGIFFRYSILDNQLTLNYSDTVTLVFEK